MPSGDDCPAVPIPNSMRKRISPFALRVSHSMATALHSLANCNCPWNSPTGAIVTPSVHLLLVQDILFLFGNIRFLGVELKGVLRAFAMVIYTILCNGTRKMCMPLKYIYLECLTWNKKVWVLKWSFFMVGDDRDLYDSCWELLCQVDFWMNAT